MTDRLMPVIDELNRHYWDGARQEKLVVLRCPLCMTYVHPPTPWCPACSHRELERAEVCFEHVTDDVVLPQWKLLR